MRRLAARPRALAGSISPRWWLAVIVGGSTACHYALARRIAGPWIMVDELIYSEIAKSLADGAAPAIRGVGVGNAYGVVYPLLVAPAWALFDSVPHAYAAAKGINSLLVSLAALPAYGLARTVARPSLALAAAALTVAVPGTLYAGEIMTENAFYPVFALAALALVRALDRPTVRRTAALLAVAALAFLTRAQAVVLLPAALLAPLVLAVLEPALPRALRRFGAYYGTIAAAGALVLAAEAVRGRSPAALLGAYRASSGGTYDAREVLRWLAWHAAELDLALAVVPVAALVLLALQGRSLDAAARRLVAATAAILVVLLPVVAAFASRYSLRVEERNVFYVAPLVLAALAAWIERGLPRPRPAVAVPVVGAIAVAPALLPFSRLVATSAVSDTFGLLPWWTVADWGVPIGRLWIPVAAAALPVGALAALVPRRGAPALLAVVAGAFAATILAVDARTHRVAALTLLDGITRPDVDWVDRALPRGATAAFVASGRPDWFTVFSNEFFSRRVGPVYVLQGRTPGLLPDVALAPDRRGVLRDARGRAPRPRFALTDQFQPVAGALVARDRFQQIDLRRVSPPLRVRWAWSGVDPDRWARGRFSLHVFRCAGGTLRVMLESDVHLIRVPQTVTASGGGRTARTTIRPGRRPVLRVPLRPRGGACDVRFRVTPTAVPARVQPGSGDTRRLGARVLLVRLRP